MFRPPLAALLAAVLLAAPAPSRAGEPEVVATETAVSGPVPAVTLAKVPFDDPAHKHFFRYQKYLLSIGLQGETKAGWNKKSAEEQASAIANGEAFLKAKLMALVNSRKLTPEDRALARAVWGAEIAGGIETFDAAKQTGDHDQMEAALKKLKDLATKFGGPKMDLNAAFDGSKGGGEEALPEVLTPKKPEAGFLASLSSPQVNYILSSRESFLKFLEQKQVPREAVPGLDAMYGVLARAKPAEKAELGHILPTVVKFILDGKKIALEPGDALGYAVPGDYDRPEKVVVTPATQKADPTVTAMVLTHEFQHIHDMYAGRYYTLDSELRGFKSEVIFMRVMRSDPRLSQRLDQLANSDDDATRGIIKNQLNFAAAYDRSVAEFANDVAFGHGYNKYSEGSFQGRLPLREALDPRTGVVRQLAAQQHMRDAAIAESSALEKKQAEIRARRDAKPSRELDKELEKVTKDLANTRSRIVRQDAEVTLGEIRLRRMQSELSWLDKKAADKGHEPPTYDLNLPVDAEYLTP